MPSIKQIAYHWSTCIEACGPELASDLLPLDPREEGQLAFIVGALDKVVTPDGVVDFRPRWRDILAFAVDKWDAIAAALPDYMKAPETPVVGFLRKNDRYLKVVELWFLAGQPKYLPSEASQHDHPSPA